MKIRIGCVDGNIYEGDEVTDEQIKEEIESSGGKIGTGFLSDVEIRSVDDFIKVMDSLFKGELIDEDMVMKNYTLTIGGQERVFRADSIVWHEIVR